MPFRHARHEAAALSLHQCRLKSTLEQNSGKRGSAKRPSHNLREQVQDVSLTTARGALLEISSPELADTLQISPRTTGSNNSRHQCSLGSSNPVRRIKIVQTWLDNKFESYRALVKAQVQLPEISYFPLFMAMRAPTNKVRMQSTSNAGTHQKQHQSKYGHGDKSHSFFERRCGAIQSKQNMWPHLNNTELYQRNIMYKGKDVLCRCRHVHVFPTKETRYLRRQIPPFFG